LGLSRERVTGLALGFHFLFSFIVVMMAYAIAVRRSRPLHFDLYCCWLFVSAYLISPRTFDYDLAVVVVPLVLLMRMLLVEGRFGVTVAVIITAFCTTLLRSPTQFQTPLSEWSSAIIIWAVWFGAAVHLLNSTEPTSSTGAKTPISHHREPATVLRS
jgi:hypothetical protein